MEGAPKIAAALREHRIARGRDVLAVVIEELPESSESGERDTENPDEA